MKMLYILLASIIVFCSSCTANGAENSETITTSTPDTEIPNTITTSIPNTTDYQASEATINNIGEPPIFTGNIDDYLIWEERTTTVGAKDYITRIPLIADDSPVAKSINERITYTFLDAKFLSDPDWLPRNVDLANRVETKCFLNNDGILSIYFLLSFNTSTGRQTVFTYNYDVINKIQLHLLNFVARYNVNGDFGFREGWNEKKFTETYTQYTYNATEFYLKSDTEFVLLRNWLDITLDNEFHSFHVEETVMNYR